MASEREHAIREVIRRIMSERDPDALTVLASELDRLLKLQETMSEHVAPHRAPSN